MIHPKRKSFPHSIETQRMRLSRWQPSDGVAFRSIAQDPRVMRYVNNGEPWSDAKVRDFIARQMRHIASNGFCFWKIQRKPDGRLIGLCGLQALRLGSQWDVEIGWWLTPPNWLSEPRRSCLYSLVRRWRTGNNRPSVAGIWKRRGLDPEEVLCRR